jgi:predicted amidophosphoribosyltransferase
LATAQEITDPHLSLYVPPPRAGPAVCRVCHTWSGDYVRCYSCNRTRGLVTHPLGLVVPFSLTRTDLEAQLYNVLRDYKSGSMIEEVRSQHRLHIAAILQRFLGRHRGCIEQAAGRAFDTIVVVPSRRGRTGIHPLEQAIDLSPLLSPLRETLLEPGPGTIGRNDPVDDGYIAIQTAAGKHVLLIDDTFATGAKLQSAASALTIGGATVVAGVVLGRVVDTTSEDPRFAGRKPFWKRQAKTPFSFDVCCLE